MKYLRPTSRSAKNRFAVVLLAWGFCEHSITRKNSKIGKPAAVIPLRVMLEGVEKVGHGNFVMGLAVFD